MGGGMGKGEACTYGERNLGVTSVGDNASASVLVVSGHGDNIRPIKLLSQSLLSCRGILFLLSRYSLYLCR